MSDPIKFLLDGVEVEAAAGETIWQVANRQGPEIPHLCYSPTPGYRAAAFASDRESTSQIATTLLPRDAAARSDSPLPPQPIAAMPSLRLAGPPSCAQKTRGTTRPPVVTARPLRKERREVRTEWGFMEVIGAGG